MLRRESQRFVRHMLRSIGGVVLPVAALLVAITAPTPAHAGVNLWTKITGGGTCPDVATIAEAASCYDAVTGPDECVVVPSTVTTPPFWTGSQWEVRLTKWVDGVWPYTDCIGWTVAQPSRWRLQDYCTVAGEQFDSTDGHCKADGPADSPPNNCGIGNPCSPATRGKYQTFVDYVGPGLRFTRSWRSRAAPEVLYGGFSLAGDGRLPAGWTHSYASRVILDLGDPVALFRPDGEFVSVYESTSDIFLATDGSGLQVRGSGSNDITVYLPDGSKEIYGYHSDTACTSGLHRLDTVIDAGGRETTVAYATACDVHPESVEGPFGHVIELHYDTVPTDTGTVVRLDHIEDPDSDTIAYDYVTTGQGDATAQLEYVTYQDASEVRYHYDDANEPGYLSGVTDERGIRYATFAYDLRGYAAGTGHAGGYEQWTFSYAPNGNVTATDANGVEVEHIFQSANPARRVLGTVKVNGVTIATMDNEDTGQLRLLSRTDANGATTTYTYSTYHRTSMTEADGTTEERLTEYQYLDDTSHRLTSVESPSVYASSVRELVTSYDAADLPDSLTISGYTPSGTPISKTVTLDYNAAGQVIEIDGSRTDVYDVTTLAYNSCTSGYGCGQLASITNALGHVTSFDTYDAHGRLTQMTDPNDVVTNYTYDLRGRVLTKSDTPPSGPVRVTTYTYDEAGLLETAEAPNGTILTYDYDAAQNLLSITDNFGNALEYGYDLAGNRTSEDTRDPSSNLRRAVDFTYDALNRLDSINAAGSITQVVFDTVGNLTDETDPHSNDTLHGYDPLNRLVETIDALSGTTGYGYDANDQLTSIEAPNGAATTYVYDDLGNLLSLTSPDTGTTTYTYDAAGNRTSQTDAKNITVNYTYDALNRLTGIDYPGSGLDVTLTYDQGTAQKGRLTAMTDGSGSTTFEYDVFGNLTEDSKTLDGHVHVTSYTYDEANLVTSATYPSSRTVEYTRNVLGQITTVASAYGGSTTTLASSATYEPFGPLKGLTFGNSLVLARTFDQQYRLTDQTTGSVQALQFTLDDAGNIDAIADGVNAGLSQGFGQDAVHRLTTDAGSYGTKSYTYDGVGNRLTRVHGATTQTLTYAASSNRLATHDAQTVTLDAAGNTTADAAATLSFSYGAHNRMLEAYVGGVLKATYVYDGRGQRVKKTEATGAQRTVIYHYGPSGELVGETVYNSSGAKIGERDYVWLDTLPIAQSERVFAGGSVTSSQLVYLHADQLGTPRLATNSSGTVVWRWDSDAFGIGAANQDPDSDSSFVNVRLRFPGQYLDEETGLHYNYFRDYDSATGKYVQSDPIGLRGGLNTYAYVGANPVTRIDPLGLLEYPDDFFGPLPPGDYHTSEMTRTACGLVPPAPPGVDILENIREAQTHWSPFWFRDQVRNNGPWDYKQLGTEYLDFGNFNYGATGVAFGFSLERLLREAGRAQRQAGTSRPEWGEPGSMLNPWGGRPPYGDDPDDQKLIRDGGAFCECMTK